MVERNSKFHRRWAVLIEGVRLLAEISQTTGKEKTCLFMPFQLADLFVWRAFSLECCCCKLNICLTNFPRKGLQFCSQF